MNSSRGPSVAPLSQSDLSREPRIAGTRIPVWLRVQGRRMGASEADLLRDYPALHPIDLLHVWTYARDHREEIERQIVGNEEA
jgi:uncharacterized protein (DUF433 family)